ncbi:hypothetical protein GWK47_030354 [Chionoecetes opilio]|uniref:Uncharacterized protein n=1 Tax=Chionoecetes opilio TaxID=41210 RepID=A0A8J4YKX3_CHIOP|nr:hypothetical protein GWK47_030354 [Chionoecetes opilio]
MAESNTYLHTRVCFKPEFALPHRAGPFASGGRINTFTEGEPKLLAALEGFLEAVKLLISHGANVNPKSLLDKAAFQTLNEIAPSWRPEVPGPDLLLVGGFYSPDWLMWDQVLKRREDGIPRDQKRPQTRRKGLSPRDKFVDVMRLK